jgi:hypothetical protein
MEISFRGQYDKDLFFRSVMLANQPPKRRRFVRTFLSVFIVVAIAVLISRLIESGDILGHATYIVVVMILGAFLLRSYLQPYLGARSMWANPSVRRKLTGVITKKGILYRLEARNNEILWERFTRVRKVNNLITLVTREGLLVIFPRAFFKNDSDWQRFERLVDTKIVSIN